MNELSSRSKNKTDVAGRPGATGVGAAVGGAAGGIAGGAAAGAAVGGMTGPVGAAVGVIVGAVAGALAGKGIANAVDPVAEDAYWRETTPAVRTPAGRRSNTVRHTVMASMRTSDIPTAHSMK